MGTRSSCQLGCLARTEGSYLVVEVSKSEVALHLPIGRFNALGWSRYRDTNPIPTNPLADDLATAPSAPVSSSLILYLLVIVCRSTDLQRMSRVITFNPG